MCRFLCLLFFLSCTCVWAKLKLYNGHQLWKVTPLTTQHNDKLHEIHRDLSDKVNFWSSPTSRLQSVAIAVPPSHQPALHDQLNKYGLTPEILVHDLQKLIDQEKWEVETSGRKNRSVNTFEHDPTDLDLESYHRYEQIVNYVKGIQQKYPQFTSLFDVGKSFEGRDLLGIQIGTQTGGRKPGIYIDAGIHAREWAAPATALYIVDTLTRQYGEDPTITALVDKLDWYILPLANPDGYEYTWTNDRYWRKTRSKPAGCKSETECCFGADPNRNWGFHFGDQLKAYITLHSYSQLWLVPYGYEKDKYPKDFDNLMDAAREAEKATEKVNGMPYKVENSATLYPAAGASDDWVKGVLGIKYVYTIELRPNEDINDIRGFSLKKDQILPTAKEIFEGIKVIAQRVINEAHTDL